MYIYSKSKMSCYIKTFSLDYKNKHHQFIRIEYLSQTVQSATFIGY